MSTLRALGGVLVVIGQAVVWGLAAAFLIGQFWPTARLAPARVGVVESYADIVERAAPSVVSIYANRLVSERPIRLVPSPLQNFFGITPLGPERLRREQSLGSAVILSADGYLLTNNHVIAGFDQIQVQLWDGRVLHASIIGTDPDTDLAVLKVEAHDLPVARIGDPTRLRVGDVVLAIGNALGYGQAVTLGIISATGRRELMLNTYENYLQTDAAINKGNSGGALVNARGELVGINTAMLSPRANIESVGFAIPIDMARAVLDDIVRQGFVTRGWLGCDCIESRLQDPTTGEATRWVQVRGIYQGAPAQLAGLNPGDFITRFAGQDIYTLDQFQQLEARTAPGTEVEVEGWRAGVPFRTQARLIQRPKRSDAR